MYVCVHSTVKTTEFILHTMYICMYVWIYVAYTYYIKWGVKLYSNVYIYPSINFIRAGFKDRQTRQLPGAPKPEGPRGFYHSKAIPYWYWAKYVIYATTLFLYILLLILKAIAMAVSFIMSAPLWLSFAIYLGASTIE